MTTYTNDGTATSVPLTITTTAAWLAPFTTSAA